MNNQGIGHIGESLACKFLCNKGFNIIGRNFLRKCGEIDVIARKEGVLHFIEVKTVTCENLNVIHETNTYRPEDNIHLYKTERLKRVIQVYLVENYIKQNWQFHAITVLFDPIRREAKIDFLENLVL
ncbi:MAG TPA: YraN family protein [Candidatus Paceibacterota bacterium]|nr:YraN family protein [Candidatus Paceibacterota bacterium]